MIRLVHLPPPPEFLMRQMAARVRFLYVEAAQKAVAEAERKLLAVKSPEDKTVAERELLEAHRGLVEAREWRP